ncbi:PREDICTED: venom protease-like isoform X1 [Nicrophorus vespilloides]|uniref:Venom protease-like isoform X1 n=1 Tax=Nicrophorus vespilloides TaxID=110193 RepID=A0ABM1MQC3_NICVS|nr:PREDICTED: venom protease-like isoform X1 [Nicrophorus vespilloides]
MSHLYQVTLLLLTITSQVHMETKDVKCEDSTKFCENIWYCKKNSYPDKYKACGHDGLVDRVCCDPEYPPTKSRKYCDTMQKKIVIDEYGNRDYSSIVPYHFNILEDNSNTAALGYRNESRTHWFCAGSLVNNKFVITAAACLSKNINIVRLGDLDLNNDNDGLVPQEFGVLKTFVHPKYKAPFVYNDIAIIELNDTVTFTKFVKPACINEGVRTREPFWREVGFKDINTLTVIPLRQLNRRACNLYFDNDKFANLVPFGLDPDTQLCASSVSSHQYCQMSVGGPLQNFDINYVDGIFLIGITAIPKPCSHTNEPGIYTRVSHYAPWIESIIFPGH